MLLSYYFYTYYARYLIDQLIVKANFITSLLHYFTTSPTSPVKLVATHKGKIFFKTSFAYIIIILYICI